MKRYLDAFAGVPSTLGYGLKQKLKEGYSGADLRADVMAGLVVGVVALPLSMALAIASGVPPQHGLYTAIIAGVICALLGGTRCQVTGPTAAFVVILVPIVLKFGFGGLLVAGFMAGIILMLMGVLKLGSLIQFIPHPVTTGFTAGIAVVIGTIQLKDFFGLSFGSPETYVERWKMMVQARGTASVWELVVGLVTLAMLIGIPRIQKKVPAPLIALVLASIGAALAAKYIPGFHVATIGSRFSSIVHGHEVRGIPPLPPMPMNPFTAAGPGGAQMHFGFKMVQLLIGPAFAIAMLGAIESLLAAVVSDGMSGTKHEPNSELMALGIANIVCPMFGGIAATGALARTATNIRAGAKTPVSGMVHAFTLFIILLVAAPLASVVPMSVLAGILLVVSYNMGEWREVPELWKQGWTDRMVWLVTFVLTVVADLTVAVEAGMILAALLFIRRVAATTTVTRVTSDYIQDGRVHILQDKPIPDYITIYRIHGPFLFGSTDKLTELANHVHDMAPIVILRLRNMTAIDATGLRAIQDFSDVLAEDGKTLLLCGALSQPSSLMEQADFHRHVGEENILPNVEAALQRAEQIWRARPAELAS